MSTFRKDINGLRAIAVIAVVLFHFNPAWLSGGFAGVDVFFVISGFLMTGIISRGIEQDNFSILKFYVARANRIIPALAVLCLALLVFGWFYLTPLDYKTLGKHAAGSIGFLSNVLYWRESGYFDASSLEKWLLHTWSLSVEWQFYIIYPLILISVRKLFSVKAIKPVILLGTILSFAFCVYATYRWPTAAYYLLPTRAWEMMIGGVAYLYPISSSNRQKRVLELVGVVLIIGSYFTVSAETFWPGYIALFPVLGSFLIIMAQRNDSLVTGNVIFQKIGLWSYSIYLWHWPLVVAIYSFSLDARFVYLGMFLSVLLGFLSYNYIERFKFRSDFSRLIHLFRCKPLYFIFFIGFSCVTIYSYYEIKVRGIEDISHYAMAGRDNGYCFGSPGPGIADESYLKCSIGAKNKPSEALLFGDSFAGHFEPLLDKIGKIEGVSVDAINTNSCFPTFTDSFNNSKSHIGYSQCIMNRGFVEENIGKYKVVFISGRWDGFNSERTDHTEEVVKMISSITRKGVLVVYLPSPSIYRRNIGKDYISYLLGGPALSSNSFSLKHKNNDSINRVEERLASYAKNNDNFIYINKDVFFRDDTFIFESDVLPFSADGGHISVFASKYLAGKLIELEEYHRIKSFF